MCAGRATAFDELYARYERRLFGFILSYVKNREDAEEIFHDVFQAVIAATRAVDATVPGRFDAWLFTVARNLCLNRIRARRPSVSLASDEAAEPFCPRESEEARLVLQGRHRALAAAVERLPPKLGEVYRLRSGGSSYEDIARHLDVPLGTIKSRVNSLVRRLKEEMDQWLAR